MRAHCFIIVISTIALSLGMISTAAAQPQHGIAMYGDPALPPDFAHLPYANPDAPTGGRIITGEVGSYDSLNPHIRRGNVPWQLRSLAYESLMGRNWDEPFSLYGLLAESVEADSAAMWVEFILRPEARFSDGSPVTVDDVIWSYETLGTVGHPRYLNAWQRVASIEPVGERGIRLTFTEPDREMALIMGLRPILQRAQWEGRDFEESGIDIIPISTAPYVIDDFEAGRFVSLRRDPNYWGADLPFRRGTNNIDEIRLEFFSDGNVMFEAFKAGEITTVRETNAANWETNYNFPRMASGEVVRSIVPHQRPTGMTGFVMNTRNPPFDDWRVREAMIQAFNFRFVNQTQNGGQDPRITSYFGNSFLSMEPGPAEGRVAELLAPFADTLLPDTLEGYIFPVSDGSAANRAGIRAALTLLEEAGFSVQAGVMMKPDGAPFEFEILLQQGSTENQAIINIYTQALERLGITPQVTVVDSAQYRERTDLYDFDMTYFARGVSLSPGNEQRLYWGSDGVTEPGTRNLMGVNDPAVEAMIAEMLIADSQDDYRAAVRALDRVLTAGRYVIPLWHAPIARIAHVRELRYPADTLPIYGDWLGFQPDVWWYEE
jgi:peptide/nickel transport system substrate-binding protein